jgi:hypothetical protein
MGRSATTSTVESHATAKEERPAPVEHELDEQQRPSQDGQWAQDGDREERRGRGQEEDRHG